MQVQAKKLFGIGFPGDSGTVLGPAFQSSGVHLVTGGVPRLPYPASPKDKGTVMKSSFPAADDVLRLHLNQNPYGPPPGAIEAATAELRDRCPAYPDSESLAAA